MSEASEAGAELGRTSFEHEIEPGLGTVAVDAWGSLLEVRLDRAGLRVCDLRTVGEKVLRAIEAAQSRAAQAVEDHLAKGADDTPVTGPTGMTS
jgi:hypothetical protein